MKTEESSNAQTTGSDLGRSGRFITESMDKYSRTFARTYAFKRRAKEAPMRRIFRHLQRHPSLDIAQAQNHIYIKTRPMDGFSLHNEGVLLLSQGRPREALDMLLKAMSVRPDIGTLYADIGVAYLKIGMIEKALQFGDIAKKKIGHVSPVPHNIRACALAKMNRSIEAIKALRESLRLDEKQAKQHRNVAALYKHRSMMQDAARHYKRSLQLEPSAPRHSGAHSRFDWP